MPRLTTEGRGAPPAVSAVALYARTLVHLRPIQVGARLWLHAPRAAIDDRPAPPGRRLDGTWTAPVARPASMTGPSRFMLLNRQGDVAHAGDWNAPDKPRLWLYNLHYFDDLNGPDAGQRAGWHAALIARWVAENPPGRGAGWEPYPLSLRMVNWIKWAVRQASLPEAARHSLAVQARYLARRIEWHLLANHLLANAKALVFAGCWFDGPEAENWRQAGLRILERELDEQILPDGGHFELSPMYHAIVLEDVLDLINLARAYPGTIAEARVRQWSAVAERMRVWLAAMVHPDGNIAYFNDAALGVGPRRSALDSYAGRLGLAPAPTISASITHLAASGYIRVEQEDMMALLDVAYVGPDYQPGHAHADTLSFECSLFGRRCIVNSGTSTYEPGPQRMRERSTAAHSTVEVDGTDSSEVWGAFRVARRARPLGLTIEERVGEIVVRCAHDGYRRLRGRPVHERCWRFAPRSLTVADRIEPAGVHSVSRLHLHPDWQFAPAGDAGGELVCGDRTARVEAASPMIEAAAWAQGFGRRHPSTVITTSVAGGSARASIRWTPRQ